MPKYNTSKWKKCCSSIRIITGYLRGIVSVCTHFRNFYRTKWESSLWSADLVIGSEARVEVMTRVAAEPGALSWLVNYTPESSRRVETYWIPPFPLNLAAKCAVQWNLATTSWANRSSSLYDRRAGLPMSIDTGFASSQRRKIATSVIDDSCHRRLIPTVVFETSTSTTRLAIDWRDERNRISRPKIPVGKFDGIHEV